MTPLHCAASVCDGVENLQYLLDNGADIDDEGALGSAETVTAVRSALIHSNTTGFRYLIEAGARLDTITLFGFNILHSAVWYGSMKCWELLAQAAENDKLVTVDTEALHDGHDLMDCVWGCRDLTGTPMWLE